MLYVIKGTMAIYYEAITDLISINLEETESMSKAVWPSEGFYLKYFVNDFSNISNVYSMWIYSDSLNDFLNESILLDTSNDACICGNWYEIQK